MNDRKEYFRAYNRRRSLEEPDFCSNRCKATKAWIEAHKNDPGFREKRRIIYKKSYDKLKLAV